MSLFGKRDAEPASGDPYGIADVVQLMRTLPLDQNPELVVQVLKSTLESVHVRVPEILDDAAKRQQALGERIATLDKEIVGFEEEIRGRREEIEQVRAELEEVTAVRERLEVAEPASAEEPSVVSD